MSSRPQILLAGALGFLQDLSNGSNIPALQPLVSIAVRVYTSAEGAKSNKKKAKVLAQDVRNAIKEILHVYPVGPLFSTQNLHEDSIRQFQRALEDVATFMDTITQRNRFWRFLNEKEDRQELSNYRTRITEAQLQFLVAIEMAKTQIQQQEQTYPVFSLKDLELIQLLNTTDQKHTRAIARLVPHQKLVLLRQYQTKSNFAEDLAHFTSLRHPNLPFLGASSLISPAPFVVLELASRTPARIVVLDLYRQSPWVLQKKAIEIITSVLDAMNYLRENNVVLSDLAKQMSSIQYDGSKVILNVDLPRDKPRSSKCSPILPILLDPKPKIKLTELTVSDDGVIQLNAEWLGKMLGSIFEGGCLFDSEWVDIPEQENEVLQALFGLPENPWPTDWADGAAPVGLWPIWQYLMNCDFKRRLHDLRNIAEQLYGASDRAFDIPLALIATGNLPYHELHRTKTDYPLELGTVACLTKQGWLVVGNILTELRDEGIIDISPFISNRIDDDEEQASPLEELIGTGNGIFSASVGDYKRYYFHQNRSFSLEIGQTTTTSLHNPRASEIRRRIQHYFHQRLPTLLKENSWHYRQPTDGFVLVTSVRSRRTTELEHNHDMTEGRDHKECLHCMMFGDRPEKDGASNDKHSIQGVYFHALPEESMAVSGPMEHNRWGCWTFHDGDREIQLEPPGRFSYTYNPDCGFEGAFEQLLD